LVRIVNVQIFDGEAVSDHTAIEFDESRIVALGAEKVPTRDAIDGDGAWLLPGLIDSHVHLELDPKVGTPPKPEDPRDLDAMAGRAREMVEAGITTARDLGGGAWAEIEIRDRILAGEILGPRLLCAGQPITSTGGHCHFWGGEAATHAQALAVLQRQLDHGVDLLKIMASGGRFTKNSDPSKAQFDLPFMKVMVDAANASNLTVAAHCHGSEAIRNAAHAGVTTIEHCSWVGSDGKWASDYQAEVVIEMARRGVWVSPTINAGWQRFLTSDTPWLSTFREIYTEMKSAGVKFVASTDAGIPGVRHHDLPKALPVFARLSGFSNADVLSSATANAADALGLQKTTGRIREGLAVDMLMVESSPIEDLAVLQAPKAIWARGGEVKALE
jgi:imidazolonepropionase-like amidohydrolase